MLNKFSPLITTTGILAMMLVLQPALSMADSGGHHNSYADHHWNHGSHRYSDYHFNYYSDDHRHVTHYDYPRSGFSVSFLPNNHFSFSVSGVRFHYSDGLYYRNINRSYVVVPPPIGAIVNTIPPNYSVTTIDGVTYYTNNNIYYVYTRQGYKVVDAPVVVVQSAPAPVAVAPVVTQEGGSNTYTVNIANDKGGYTAVNITKSGSGYVGPQGEFYAEFPKVTQLQAMYGK